MRCVSFRYVLHTQAESGASGLGQSPVEFGAADAEQLRCLGHVAVCLCQGLLDKGDPVRRGRSPACLRRADVLVSRNVREATRTARGPANR